MSWKPQPRAYEARAASESLPLKAVHDAHPLAVGSRGASSSGGKGSAASKSADEESDGGGAVAAAAADDESQDFVDPLSLADNPLMDNPLMDNPLAASAPALPPRPPAASGGSSAASSSGGSRSSVSLDARLAEGPRGLWAARKDAICAAYAATDVIMNVDMSEDPSASEPVSISLDRAKNRLENLEAKVDSGGPGGQQMTTQQYATMVKRLNTQLAADWARNARVSALKNAIRCSKMLGDVSVPGFYPTMFVLITDVLDTFSDLVFARILQKAREPVMRGDPMRHIDAVAFTSADISDEAKETCRNWFFKTQCIRELLPRLFMELALLPCYRFLSDDAMPLSRLRRIIRGIGDPMVALYARVYLARRAAVVLTNDAKSSLFLQQVYYSLDDYLVTFREFEGRGPVLAANLGGDMNAYYHIHTPAITFLCDCAAHSGATTKHMQGLLRTFKASCNHNLFLKSLFTAFPSKLYSAFTPTVINLVKGAAESTTADKSESFKAIGRAFIVEPPPMEHRLLFLNETWRVVTTLTEAQRYTSVCAVFVDLLARHYSERELLVVLKDLARHISASNASDPIVMSNLEKVVSVVTQNHSQEFGEVLTSQHFMAVLDLFQGEKKSKLCKQLLQRFVQLPGTTDDTVVIQTMFDLTRTLHDSIDSLSFDDERKQVDVLMCKFIKKIDFGRNLEAQLNMCVDRLQCAACALDLSRSLSYLPPPSLFTLLTHHRLRLSRRLVDARGALPNLMLINHRLVIAAATLAVNAHKMMRGKHSRRTFAFVKACIAFCHISVASLADPIVRVNLFILSAQVALLNGCLPQTDTCLGEAIDTLAAIPDQIIRLRGGKWGNVSSEPFVCEAARNICAFLVVVPGHPDASKGPFHMVQKLIAGLKAYAWPENSQEKLRLHLHVISTVAALSQEKLMCVLIVCSLSLSLAFSVAPPSPP